MRISKLSIGDQIVVVNKEKKIERDVSLMINAVWQEAVAIDSLTHRNSCDKLHLSSFRIVRDFA